MYQLHKNRLQKILIYKKSFNLKGEKFYEKD